MPTHARTRTTVVLVTLTFVAVALGHGVAWQLAGACLDVPASMGTIEATAPTEAAIDPCALLDRHALFGSTLDVSCDEGPRPPIVPPVGAGSVETPCPSTLRLVGAVVPRDGSPAFAAIADATGASLLYAEGMRVGDHEVRHVGRDEVVLAQGADACLLTMFEHAPPASFSLDRTAPPAPRVASLADDDAIRSTGPASFRVRRTEIERLVQSGELFSLRAIPHQDANGAIDGYRIYGIRDGSPAARLGVQNGDTVVSIDGQPLTNVTLAVDAVAGIGTASSASIGVLRRGQPLRLDYQLD